MNLTIIVGWIFSVFCLVVSILLVGNIGWFADAPSVFIVIGGTLGALVACMSIPQLKNMGKWFKIAIFPPKFDPNKYITEIVEYATIARGKGLLALEESANGAKDPFMKSALMLIVDANDPDKVREMLEGAVEYTAERHREGPTLFALGATMAPAFGMMGTVIALVAMLKKMGDDPGSIGESMAVAIITTLYGSVVANVVFGPLEATLKRVHADEELCMNMVIEGVMAIAAGSNPRFIQEKLEFMLPSSKSTKDKK